jgi:hypothetical protein
MELRYNLIPKNKFNIIFIHYNKNSPINNKKPLKLFFKKYKILKLISLNQYNEIIELHKNNIFINKNTTLIISNFSDPDYSLFWFYENYSTLNEDIINSYNNDKLKILNSNIDKLILPNLKFKDIFILLYNNGKI